MQDWQLLQEFVKNESQAAFGQIVERHLNFVYSTCLRELGDSGLAEDATQTVFLLLSQKASTLRPGTILSGWLFQTARFVSKNARKQETRWRQRTQKAVEETMHEVSTRSSSEEEAWAEIEPLLHEAMNGLSPADRNAVLLRCFEGRSLKQTGEALGVTEEAARKRVARALEKLRRYFTRHGVTLSAITLAALLSSQAVQAAPAGLSALMSTLFPATAMSAAAGSVASGVFSAKSIALSQSVKHAWLLAKIKVVVTAVCGVSLVALGTGQLIRHTGEIKPSPPLALLAKRPSVQTATATHKRIRLASTALRPMQRTRPQAKPVAHRSVAPRVLLRSLVSQGVKDSALPPPKMPVRREQAKSVIRQAPIVSNASITAQKRDLDAEQKAQSSPEVPEAFAPEQVSQVSTREQTTLPRDNNRRKEMQIKKTVVSALVGAAMLGSALAPQQVIAAEGDKGTVTGLLVAKGENWVEVRGDDAKEAKRFGPRWIGGLPKDGGGLDKAVLEEFKKLPVPNRVKLDWATEEGVRVTHIELIAPAEKTGVVEGAVTALGDRWVEVKAGDKPAERYSPRWTEGGPDKDALRAIGELKAGDKVRLEWSYNERLRIVSLKKAD